jgi:3-deoxy-D-manno-octulosonic-acid transferase
MPEGCGRGKDAEGGIAAQSEKLRQWDRVIIGRLGLQVGETIIARDLEQRIRERIPDVGEICTNCTSASPSGFAEYRRAIEKGLWPE